VRRTKYVQKRQIRKAKYTKQKPSSGISYRRRTKLRDRMDPEEKQEEQNECLTANVVMTREGRTDGTNQTIERAEKVRPLPIIVGKVQNYQEMYNHLKRNNNRNFQRVLLNSGDIKINEEKDYRDITRVLNQTNIG
jgi:hypothetical protein